MLDPDGRTENNGARRIRHYSFNRTEADRIRETAWRWTEKQKSDATQAGTPGKDSDTIRKKGTIVWSGSSH